MALSLFNSTHKKLHSVVKAKFQVREDSGVWSSPMDVMFNPSEIALSSAFRTTQEKSIANGKQISQTAGPTTSSVSMHLIFDLVPAYEAALKEKPFSVNLASSAKLLVGSLSNKSINGAIDEADEDMGNLITVSDATGVSLLNAKVGKFDNSFYWLKKAAEEQLHICFAWGDILVYGRLTDFNPRLTYFSKQGAPLRAEVDISITNFADQDKADKQNNKKGI